MIDPSRYGVSFSIKQCRNFGIDPHKTLDWLLAQGWRRFRLMSYWDEHEKEQGRYAFTELDWQIAAIQKAGGVITLALGAKQPRWPEYHWPSWAWQASKHERDKALLNFVGATVKHCRGHSAIVSWQLENEALLRGFGSHIEIDRERLQQEYRLVQRLDPSRPIIMSTSNGWGVPVRAPHPDVVGFSCYFRRYNRGRYRATVQSPWLHRWRAAIIRAALGKSVFIHELQCEPWGPKPIWQMDIAEQDKSMDTRQIRHNIAAAKSIGILPIDLWGAEWWYWRHRRGDEAIWDTVRSSLKTD